MTLAEKILDLFFPPRCVLCEEVCPSGTLCCNRCTREEPPGAQPLRYGDSSLSQPWSILGCAFSYQGRVRSALSRFKFNGDRRIGAYLGASMVTLLKEEFPDSDFQLIVPVPMPPDRQRLRGYNQAELLAQQIAKIMNIQIAPQALVRRGAFAQHELTIGFRQREAEYSFLPGDISLTGQRVLLVDDVVTTGNTAAICCRILLEMGASEVSVLAAAG